MNTSSHIIEASYVTKSFGEVHALRQVSISVRSGECLGLLGPNGAGKSTFISCLYGASKLTSGTIKVFGFDVVTQLRDLKRKLGVVPQENALDEALSVVENMRLYARFVAVPPSLIDARIDELLKYMSLDHKKHVPIRALSGGMKRRLAFVRALLSEPELLILDEPTTGLDPTVRHLIWQKVGDLRRKGKTLLITTHYMHEAEALCDRIIIINQGRIVAEGSPKELILRHTPGFVAMYAQSENIKSKLTLLMGKGWDLYFQQDHLCVRAPKLMDLIELQGRAGEEPILMRPANLEDVYLKLTGEELRSED